MKRILPCLAWVLFGLGLPAWAGDHFRVLPLKELAFEGAPPRQDAGNVPTRNWRDLFRLRPLVTLDGGGEAFFSFEDRPLFWSDLDEALRTGEILIRAPEGAPLSGRLLWPDYPEGRLTAHPFTVPAAPSSTEARRRFFVARHAHYRRLAEGGLPGAAWFRRQAEASSAAAGKKIPGPGAVVPAPPPRPGTGELADTFSLFTGGRALAENLQLDRGLLLRGEDGKKEIVELRDIPGVTVREMDWGPLTEGLQPELDPLSRLIPADQHAVFFPRFESLEAVMEEADRRGTPVLQLLDPRAEDYGVKARYQEMLCMPLTELGRKVGRLLIRSAAVTGSDPYLRMGSDVAVLFETDQPKVLEALMRTQRAALTAGKPGLAADDGKVGGVLYSGLRTPDRSVSSYLAVLDGAVVVANSPALLRRLAETAGGQVPALRSSPEYVYFRARYPRGAPEEDAFLLLTDAAIRRWCSPRWRIADSRRVRALSVLAGCTAEHLATPAAGKAPDRVLVPATESVFGEIALRNGRVVSSTYGTLNFMTPILELPVKTVTKAEADAYGRWRDSYQGYWRAFFDPIAVRLTVKSRKTGVDLTVMPLILGTDYANWIRFTEKGCLAPDGAGLHDALVHLAVGIDPESEPVRRVFTLFRGMAGNLLGDPLNWLGRGVSVFLDDDPVWAELKAAPDADAFLKKNFQRLPIGFYAEVASPMKLVVFLTGLRAYVDQAAPGMTVWEPRTWKETPYVHIGVSEQGRRDFREVAELNLFYLAARDSFLLTLNEDVVKRCIDQRVALEERKEKREAVPPPARPWLGGSYGLQADGRALDLVDAALGDSYRRDLRNLSWDNLPILNEWKRLFPGEDPVAVHERMWGVRLLCPGGGTYRWNEACGTMESTVFGHPGDRRPGPPLAEALRGVRFGNFGLTFEEKGLRARVELELGAPAPAEEGRATVESPGDGVEAK
ncbi:MAG: hypothetical protein KA419_17850 [Acidobacteria bacterium]|nr:hypothetical protein [Acidobacteriota bacterium]